MERILRWIWRLYPRSFRERFGPELDRDLRIRRDSGHRTREPDVADALTTLARAWLSVGSAALSGHAITDVTLAVRSLRRAPGYAIGVVAILALALGANTAVFSVTHAVLLRALPYGAPERVYTVQPTPLTIQDDQWRVDPDFTALPHVEAAALYTERGGANARIGEVTARVTLAQVTEDFFRVLDVAPLLGRGFDAGDRDVAVLSYDFWLQAYGGNAGVIGRTLELNGRPYDIIGVMPDDIAFPAAGDLWLTFPTEMGFYTNAVGPSALALLRPGADAGEVAEIINDRAAAQYADADIPPGFQRPPVRVQPLREKLTGPVRPSLYALMGIAGLVVLLGCLNLAGLVLSRTTQRMSALSIRRALGASRSRLFTQLMAEVLILAGLAGVIGLGTASVTTTVLRGMLPAATPGLEHAGVGFPVLLFSAAMAVLSGLLVGLVPSLHGAWAGEDGRPSRTSTDDRRRLRAHDVLVVGQVAVAAILVAGASLLGSSLRNLEAVPLGYDVEHVVTFQVRLPEVSYPDDAARAGYLGNLQEGLRGLAGVRAVGATTFLPHQDVMSIGLRLSSVGGGRNGATVATWIQVTSGYFDAIGTRAVGGTPFDEPTSGRWDRVVISESLAQAVFGDAAPDGAAAEVWRGGESSTPTVIDAVVSDVRLWGRDGQPSRMIYTNLEVSPPAYLSFAVRTEGEPTLLMEGVRQVTRAVDPSVPPYDVSTTGLAAAGEIVTERAVALLSRLFSASALILAALGQYGLVAQGLARRRRELGIRLVMGAHPGQLVRSALVRPVRLAVLGLAVGVGAALWAARFLAPLLFDVEPYDPAALFIVVVLVLAVATAAAYLPARRIARIDPTESLRAE